MAERGKKTFFVETRIDLLLLEESVSAFADISSDGFYLTCFSKPLLKFLSLQALFPC